MDWMISLIACDGIRPVICAGNIGGLHVWVGAICWQRFQHIIEFNCIETGFLNVSAASNYWAAWRCGPTGFLMLLAAICRLSRSRANQTIWFLTGPLMLSNLTKYCTVCDRTFFECFTMFYVMENGFYPTTTWKCTFGFTALIDLRLLLAVLRVLLFENVEFYLLSLRFANDANEITVNYLTECEPFGSSVYDDCRNRLSACARPILRRLPLIMTCRFCGKSVPNQKYVCLFAVSLTLTPIFLFKRKLPCQTLTKHTFDKRLNKI